VPRPRTRDRIPSSARKGGRALTEVEWLVCEDPDVMWEYLRTREGVMSVTAKTWDTIQVPEMLRSFLLQKCKPTLRKVRLYAVATCRRFWDELPTPECRELVRAVENYVEGSVSWVDVMAAKQAARLAAATRIDEWQRTPHGRRLSGLNQAVENSADNRLWMILAVYSWSFIGTTVLLFGEHVDAAQCDLIREVFGHPFRKVRFNKKWRTDTVLSLARQMYESRDFTAMPILADALQDAGCNSADILDHCRGAGPHCRGCWVVDLVLGK
jgi:hypothetical protein